MADADDMTSTLATNLATLAASTRRVADEIQKAADAVERSGHDDCTLAAADLLLVTLFDAARAHPTRIDEWAPAVEAARARIRRRHPTSRSAASRLAGEVLGE